MKLHYVFFTQLLLAASVTSAWPKSLSADDRSRAGAEKLLDETEELSDIRVSGSPSFRLRARLLVYESKDEKEGTYVLLWKSPTIWRDEVKFLDYSQVRVALGDKLLISRSPSGPGAEVFALLRLMEFPGSWRSAPNLELQKLEEKYRHGRPERVIEMTVSGRPWRKVYLDVSAPIVTEIEHKGAFFGAHYPYKDFEARSEFQDYMEFHGHQFPRKLSHYVSNVHRGEIQVLELTEAEFNTPHFDPPSDSHWIHWCPHPQFPKLIPNVDEVRPVPPPQFRAGAPRLHAEIYGIVGTDGHWHNLTAVKSAGQAVDSFFMNVMQRTSYSPAQCDGVPVEYEYVLEFDYP